MFSGLRPAKIKFYIRCLSELGYTSKQVLAGTQLSENELDNRDFLIDTSRYIRILSNIHKLYGAPSLAFELGKKLTLGDLGILGYAIMSSPNSGAAMSIWHQYLPLFFGNMLEASYEKKLGKWLVQYTPIIDIKPELLQFLIEEKINYDVALQRLIGMDEYPMEHLSLTYPEPPHKDLYTTLLGSNVAFSAKRNLLVIKNYALDLPLKGANDEMNEFCLTKLATIFDRVNFNQSHTFLVKDMLYDNLDNVPSIEDMANKFCCSARTFSRKLNSEGINYTDLVADTRREMAKNYLATSNYSVKEISLKLGFSDVSSFRRFFKTTTGKTISEFKLKVLAAP